MWQKWPKQTSVQTSTMTKRVHKQIQKKNNPDHGMQKQTHSEIQHSQNQHTDQWITGLPARLNWQCKKTKCLHAFLVHQWKHNWLFQHPICPGTHLQQFFTKCKNILNYAAPNEHPWPSQPHNCADCCTPAFPTHANAESHWVILVLVSVGTYSFSIPNTKLLLFSPYLKVTALQMISSLLTYILTYHTIPTYHTIHMYDTYHT